MLTQKRKLEGKKPVAQSLKALYRHAEEIVLRPGVLGGLLGAGPFPLVLPLKTLLTRTQ
jgi:hypothetical protein